MSPRFCPRNMSNMAQAPRTVENPDLNNPTMFLTLSAERMTAFQKGAMT